MASLSAGRRAMACRRGATAMVFAVSLVAIFGFVGLATEIGTWYLIRRDAQNAADAAALAGALMIASSPSNVAGTVNDVVGKNGFSSPTINYPSASQFNQSQYIQGTPVEVTVSETPSALISQLFGVSPPQIGALATGAIVVTDTKSTCALSLTGDLVIASGATVTSVSCTYASAATDSKSIDVQSSAASAFWGVGLNSAGGINNATGHTNFTGPTGVLGRGAAAYQVAATDPYASSVASAVSSFPAFSAATCVPWPTTIPAAGVPAYETAGANNPVYCANNGAGGGVITISSVTPLQTGTFFFYNTSLSVASTGTLICTVGCSAPRKVGANIVFVGSGAYTGTLQVASSATISLLPVTSNGYAGLSGILFYGAGTQDVSIAYNSTRKTVVIGGNSISTTAMYGGLYFPNAKISFQGNATPSLSSTCLVLVAKSLTFTGSSTLNPTTCGTYSTAIPNLRAARLVE